MSKYFFAIAFVFTACFLSAHSGGLDSNGGHWDRKAGTYHYHRAPSTPAPSTPTYTAPAQTAKPAQQAEVTAEEFSGKVVGITDGDTIKVMRNGKEVVVRLNGIDCPESGQAFGARAKQYSSDQCFGSTVRVVIRDTDQYGRLVGDVFISDGSMLNRNLVSAGFAWHYTQYSSDQVLARLQAEAKNARAGLWTDANPVPPWDFRK